MNEYFKFIAEITSITGILAFLGKSYFGTIWKDMATLLNARNIAFEQKIGTDLATKSQVADLTKIVAEVNEKFDKSKIQFTKLHEKRCEVIGVLYNKIYILHLAILDLTAYFRTVEEDAQKEEQNRISETSAALEDFRDYFGCNKFYFEKSTSDIIEELREHCYTAIIDRTSPIRAKNMGLEGKDLQASHKKAYDASEFVREKIPPVLTRLENEFRKLLGVETN